MALMFLENSDQTKYGSILRGLTSQYSLNQDQYPETINHTVSNHKFDPKLKKKHRETEEKANRLRKEKLKTNKMKQIVHQNKSILLNWKEYVSVAERKAIAVQIVRTKIDQRKTWQQKKQPLFSQLCVPTLMPNQLCQLCQ
jgi:hypothetical protein